MLVYKNGTIRLLGSGVGFREDLQPERGVIKKLSSKSRQRMVFVVNETQVEFSSMLTLTYPKFYHNHGFIVKRHLRKVLDYLPSLLGLGVQYFWFTEFQKRGAPHFHVLINFAPSHTERAKMAFKWSEIVGGDDQDKVFFVHNTEAAWGAIRSKDGARHYVAKYATKTEQKEVPPTFWNIGRFWGCSARVMQSIQPPIVVDTTEDEVRQLLKIKNSPVANFEFLPSYVFNRQIVSRETIEQDKDNTLTKTSINDTLVSE